MGVFPLSGRRLEIFRGAFLRTVEKLVVER